MESTSNEAWIVFKDIFLTVADKHAPVATRRVLGFSVPWLTPSIKELMTERDYHHKKAIKQIKNCTGANTSDYATPLARK